MIFCDSTYSSSKSHLRVSVLCNATMADSGAEQENKVILNIPLSSLKLLRCELCNKYLSSSPIFSNEDGKNVCNFCCTHQELNNYYRNFLYENAVREFAFPCPYLVQGCKESVLFDDKEHERHCFHRSFKCPASTACVFKGNIRRIIVHLVKQHLDMIFNGNSIEFTIARDLEVPKITKILFT